MVERKGWWYSQRLENLENESGHGKVMERLRNMKNSPKVMEFCYQSWNFTNIAPLIKFVHSLPTMLHKDLRVFK